MVFCARGIYDKVMIVGIVLSVIFCASTAFALENHNLMFWNGDMQIFLNKNVYSAGENLKATIRISNGENYFITDGKIVIEIVYGCDTPTYPAQVSDCDDVIYEKVLRDIHIPPKGNREINFSYSLPQDLREGTYRVDAYFTANRAPVKGIHFIFLPGAYQDFRVENTAGDYPSLKILRTKTVFNGERGQVAAPVQPGGVINGTVWVEALDDSAIGKNYMLRLRLCSWDDTNCDGYNLTKRFYLDSKVQSIWVKMKAPTKPDAYAIRIEIVDENGRLQSLYRSRIIVTGITAKIRKVQLASVVLRKGTPTELNVLVGTSPDHYTEPEVRNVVCAVKITDKPSEKLVFTGKKTIEKLSSKDNIIFVPLSFSITPNTDTKNFRVCIELRSEAGKLFDKYCFDVNANDYKDVLLPDYSAKLLKYFENNRTAVLEVCARYSIIDKDANIMADLLLYKNNGIIKMVRNVKINGCKLFSFDKIEGEPGVNYTLVLNDKVNDLQYIFNFSPRSASENTAVPASREQRTGIGNGKLVLCIMSLVAVVVIIAFIMRNWKGGENA